MNTEFSVVLWDFGGVLTTSPFDNFNSYERDHGLPKDFIRSVNATNPNHNALAKFESSQISVDEFDQTFADESAALGHRIDGKAVLALLSGAVRPRMVNALHYCKRFYRVACLTNNVKWGRGSSMAVDDQRAADVKAVMGCFDLVIESSVEGLRKPQPALYELACERLATPPGQIVYLDDLGINLKPASAMGMTTIKVVTERQALDDLGTTLGTRFT